MVLDGQGADEIFAGYNNYKYAYLAELLSSGKIPTFYKILSSQDNLLKALQGCLLHFVPKQLQEKLFHLINHNESLDYINWSKLSVTSNCLNNPIFDNIFATKNSYLKHRLMQSLCHYGLADLLRYQDRNSMSYSLESRVPFLNTEIIDFIYSLPSHFLISNNGTSKYILREALRGIVPDIILDRKDKIGFRTSESDLLNYLTNEGEHKDFFVPDWLIKNKAKDKIDTIINDNNQFSFQAWRIYNFILWHNHNVSKIT